ncbi:ADP-heptose:LPS heptosyltransferase [Candidatus Pelagibacter ubique]|uniref:ADP-heptose:LPS heptosyltransferase n=1 Tax=Pelagibacter ubique TaxID=198252 RepID=A0ABX1T235_PELUQ|nr:glycosyltransferase family 9 protein [Candidatus Pelagibacter ubique]NMN68152.1 ADP-heptose:LPS heptosyltransferase [Candidatus Pelagibacter ubique]
MSNILIIKHGSLGDIAQASGAIQDISENHKEDQIHLLTTKPYFELFKKNPFIHNTILDKRLSKFNLIYLYQLTRKLKNLNFKKIYDLQNSSRTVFYKNILFPKSKFDKWSSSETTLPTNITKVEFDKNPVLDRFDHQLKTSSLNTSNTMKPNFSWACGNIDSIKRNYDLEKYIVLFPFCSAHLQIKKWPYYNKLIELIKNKYNSKFKVVVAPGPSEIKDAKDINALSILDSEKILDIAQLSSLIKDSSFVIANDTGPAHMAAHLNAKGLALFGKHTTAFKVSIERENFKAIQVDDLNKLSAEKVFERLSNSIS